MLHASNNLLSETELERPVKPRLGCPNIFPLKAKSLKVFDSACLLSYCDLGDKRKRKWVWNTFLLKLNRKNFMCQYEMWHLWFTLQVRIARIFNTYGPRMCLDDGRVVSNFVAQVNCTFFFIFVHIIW